MTRVSWASLKFLLLWQAPAATVLLLARLAVLLVPFRSIIRYSGARPSKHAVVLLPTNGQQTDKARHTGKVIARARRILPLEINCFPQALTAIFMLRLRKAPYSLFFGVRRDGDAFKAHAWVCCGHTIVCGGNGHSEFRIISTYIHEPKASF